MWTLCPRCKTFSVYLSLFPSTIIICYLAEIHFLLDINSIANPLWLSLLRSLYMMFFDNHLNSGFCSG